VPKDVRHVPNMRLCLISVGKLDDVGLINHFGGGKQKLTNGSLIAARGVKEGSLYVMQGNLCIGEVNVVHNNSNLELWHRRLGHISKKQLQILARKEVIPDLRSQLLESCTACLAGKQHRVTFQKNGRPSRRKHILDLVHTDVCSTSTKSLNGALYFVTFIDDHSRNVWFSLLRSKDEALEAFKEFHMRVERETDQKLKCIRNDNDGEYRSPFETYCKLHEIRFGKTPPKTPQLNGLAEMMNRSIEERVWYILSHVKLPKSFWGKAVKNVVDIINLSPSVPLQGDIPEEVWSGKKASYNHLKLFDC